MMGHNLCPIETNTGEISGIGYVRRLYWWERRRNTGFTVIAAVHNDMAPVSKTRAPAHLHLVHSKEVIEFTVPCDQFLSICLELSTASRIEKTYAALI